MEFIKALSQGWVGSLIGLIGLVIAFLLYRASRVGPRPVYHTQALRLIGREEQALPEEVTVLFRDKKVERLTKTYIILWNSGKATVNGENIVVEDPLRLEFSEDSEVLSARVLNFTRRANNFTVNINPRCPNQVICSFDYLDAGDGAAIELLHTDEKRYPKVQGSIRGIPKGLLSRGRIFLSPEREGFPFRVRTLKIVLIAQLFYGMLLVAYGFLRLMIIEPMTLEWQWVGWFVAVSGLIIIGVCSSLLWVTRRRFPKALSIEDIE